MPFWHEFGLTKLLSRSLAKTQPIHFFRPKSHVLGSFARFGSRKCTVAKSGPGMPFGHGFGPMKLFLCFPAKMDPIHYFRSNTHVLVSHHLVAASAPLRNGVLGCRLGTSSGQQFFFRDFPPKRIQSTTLGPKLMFWVVSHHLVAASAALPNRVLGCRFGTSLS